MISCFRNCSLFKHLIVPMVLVGIIGASAIVVSAIALQHSVRALGEMYSASGERLEVLQDLDILVVDFLDLIDGEAAELLALEQGIASGFALVHGLATEKSHFVTP